MVKSKSVSYTLTLAPVPFSISDLAVADLPKARAINTVTSLVSSRAITRTSSMTP